MKRILTIALAAMLVVAFAIPAFAAPKIELVGAKASFYYDYDSTNPTGVVTPPVFDWLKVKVSADNFVLNSEIVLGALVGDYDFSLALPYMTLSGMYNDYTSLFAYHGGHELRLASDEKFKEMAGFNWAVYTNDDAAAGVFGSAHAQISVPVGENFTGSLNWAYEGSHLGYLDVSYTISEGLSVAAQVAKNIDSATDNFFGALTVNFPIVEGFNGTFFADYGMANFAPDTDFYNYGSYMMGYAPDNFESYLDFNYANENAHAELFVDYVNTASFGTRGDIFAMAEYASNSKNSLWSSNTRRALYADTEDGYGRNWNTQYKWVRNNNGNNFAVRAQGNLFNDNTWNARMYAMFAPEVIPVVLTAKGQYGSDGAWYAHNWVGIRLNEDIHLAVWDRYIWHLAVVDDPATPADETAAAYGQFDVDTALVYNRDNVTCSLTATNLVTGWGAELYLGIEF